MPTGYSRLIRYVAASMALFGIAVEPRSALAYRPFDGTDAAVARQENWRSNCSPRVFNTNMGRRL